MFEFKILPNLSSKDQDFAIAALMYVARFYSDAVFCLLRDLDLRIATSVQARMCDYTNEGRQLKLSMPRDCKFETRAHLCCNIIHVSMCLQMCLYKCMRA